MDDRAFPHSISVSSTLSVSTSTPHYGIRLVHRTCTKYTFNECLDAIFYPMTVNPRYALWLRDLQSKEGDIGNDVLFELRREKDDRKISLARTRFTEVQHRSIIKYNPLCETSAQPDTILSIASEMIKDWNFLTFVRSHRELANRLRNSLPLLNSDTKYSEWFQVYQCPRPIPTPTPPLTRSPSSSSSSTSSCSSCSSNSNDTSRRGWGRGGYTWRLKSNTRLKRYLYRFSVSIGDGDEKDGKTLDGEDRKGPMMKEKEQNILPRWSSSMTTIV